METCRVLTMLNAQASRQLQNEQLDAAKRTVNEAIRYYDESKSILRSSNLPPNEAALVQCQAQVSALLKLKIGRREAAMGSQTHNDRLTQSGKKMITQSTRSLREILQDKKTTPPPMIQRTVNVNVNVNHQQIASNFSHRPHSTVYVVPPPPPPSSSAASYVLSPAATKPTTTALEEWLRLTRSMNDTYNHVPSTAGGVNHINNNNNLSSCITDNEDGEDMGYCDCAVQIKRKYQQHQAQQQSLQQLKAPQSTMATTSSTATTASVAATTTSSTTTVASRAEETETQPNAF